MTTVGIIFGISKYNKIQKEKEKTRNTIVSIITMDVNPSIEINLNNNKEVVSVKPLNEDSIKLLEDKDFKWNSLEDTMESLITLLKDNDYFNEETNTILINVETSDEELSNLVKDTLDRTTKEKQINTDIVILSVEETEELKDLSMQYGITVSKAYYIEEQIKDEEGLKLEDFKDASLNEIKSKVEDYKEEQERIKKEEEEKKQSSSSSSSSKEVRSGSLKICEGAVYNLSAETAKSESLDTIGADSYSRSFAQTTVHNYNGTCAWETIFYFNKKKYIFYHNVTTGELLYQTSETYFSADIDSVNDVVKNEFVKRFGASKDDVFVEGIDDLLTYDMPNCTATVKYDNKWYTVVINKQSGSVVSFTEGSRYH